MNKQEWPVVNTIEKVISNSGKIIDTLIIIYNYPKIGIAGKFYLK